MENKKVIVTEEEAKDRILQNFETMSSEYGKIRVSKNFFKACAGIGVLSTGVGIVGLVGLGFVLVPVLTTGLGVAAIATSLKFHKDESKRELILNKTWEKNDATGKRIIAKSNKVR